jgi:alpha-galactosidase
MNLHGFFEDEHTGQWLIARGTEDEVFTKYTELLGKTYGKGRFQVAPRVWCSWYSMYGWINERVFLQALNDFGDMPFDVFQLDDGWQIAHGDWEANSKFPSGMKAIADKIKASGRTPGIWLAPFMVAENAQLAKDHPDWLLRDDQGNLIHAGISWNGSPLCLDVTHPEVMAGRSENDIKTCRANWRIERHCTQCAKRQVMLIFSPAARPSSHPWDYAMEFA